MSPPMWLHPPVPKVRQKQFRLKPLNHGSAIIADREVVLPDRVSEQSSHRGWLQLFVAWTLRDVDTPNPERQRPCDRTAERFQKAEEVVRSEITIVRHCDSLLPFGGVAAQEV